MYRIFTFREFKSIHKGKTAILHLRFGTEKNRRLGSKKAQYNRAFRRRHLFCLHIMAQMVHSLGSLPCSPTRTRPSKQPPAVSLLRNPAYTIKNPVGKKPSGILAQMVHSLGSLSRSPTRTRPAKQPPAVSLLRNRLFESLRPHQ